MYESYKESKGHETEMYLYLDMYESRKQAWSM